MLGQDLPLPQVSVSRLVETPEDILGQFQQFIDSRGVLNIHSALTTGDDFFVDGAQATSDALSAQFPSLSSERSLPPTSLWTRQDLRDHFFDKADGVPDAGALYAHYNHWLAQPASPLPRRPPAADFATTADVGAALAAALHDRLSRRPQRPDTVGGPVGADDQKRQLDWAQAYGQSKWSLAGGRLRGEHRLRLRRHEDGRPLRAADEPVRPEPEHRRDDRRAVGTGAPLLLQAGRRLRRRRPEGDRRGDDVRAALLRVLDPGHGADRADAPATHLDGGLGPPRCPRSLTANITGHGAPGAASSSSSTTRTRTAPRSPSAASRTRPARSPRSTGRFSRRSRVT